MGSAITSERSEKPLPQSDVRFVNVGGLHIRIFRTGEGQPLLLIGGLGNNLEVWSSLVAELNDVEVIAVDAPGMGHSDTPCRPLTMFELADFYTTLLRTVGVERATVCGLSFGGAVAQQMAYQSPRTVERLVLCGTGPGAGGYPGSPLALAELAMPWRYYSETRLRSVARTIYGGRIAQDPEMLDRHLKHRLDAPPSVLGYYYQLAALAGWSSLPWLREVSQPTLVIAGDADPVFPVANAHMIGRAIPNSAVRVLPGAGHMFVVDSAELVAPLVTTHMVSA